MLMDWWWCVVASLLMVCKFVIATGCFVYLCCHLRLQLACTLHLCVLDSLHVGVHVFQSLPAVGNMAGLTYVVCDRNVANEE